MLQNKNTSYKRRVLITLYNYCKQLKSTTAPKAKSVSCVQTGIKSVKRVISDKHLSVQMHFCLSVKGVYINEQLISSYDAFNERNTHCKYKLLIPLVPHAISHSTVDKLFVPL